MSALEVGLFPDAHRVLLVEDGGSDEAVPGGYTLPSRDQLDGHGLPLAGDAWESHPVAGSLARGVIVDRESVSRIAAAVPGARIVTRREAASLMDMDAFWRMNRAYHLAEWDRTSRFCGACGKPTEMRPTEIARTCAACGVIVYPRISPAVIVAVVRDGQILLAHNHRHGGNIYSVLAGFVEPGETLEGCVSREVQEESGITVRNIRYFTSQPWPFPNSLMIAFTAEYAAGVLRPEPDEIDELDWFAADALPAELPTTFSVARRLIEWFVTAYGTPDDVNALLRRP